MRKLTRKYLKKTSTLPWISKLMESPIRLLSPCMVGFCTKKLIAARRTKKHLWPRPRPVRSHSHSMKGTYRQWGIDSIWQMTLMSICWPNSALASSLTRSWSPDTRWWSKRMNMTESRGSDKLQRRACNRPSFHPACKTTKMRSNVASKKTLTQLNSQSRLISSSASSPLEPAQCPTSARFKKSSLLRWRLLRSQRHLPSPGLSTSISPSQPLTCASTWTRPTKI